MRILALLNVRTDPYPKMSPVEAATQVTHGLRLPTPARMSEDMKSLFASCFAKDPNYRPSFEQIEKQLQSFPQLFN